MDNHARVSFLSVETELPFPKKAGKHGFQRNQQFKRTQ
jgi:hypothetical protein